MTRRAIFARPYSEGRGKRRGHGTSGAGMMEEAADSLKADSTVAAAGQRVQMLRAGQVSPKASSVGGAAHGLTPGMIPAPSRWEEVGAQA
jgi:hypothetical protein